MDEVVVVLVGSAGADCVRLRHQIALEPCEPRTPDARFAISCPLDFFLNPIAGDEAGAAEVRRLYLVTARKRDRLVGRPVLEIAEELDLDARPLDRDQPAPAIDLRIRFGIDRLERGFQCAEIALRVSHQGDVDVDVGRAEVRWRLVSLSAGEEFRDETSEHDEVKFVTVECVEETDEGVLGKLAGLW